MIAIRLIIRWRIHWILNLFQTTALKKIVIVSFGQLVSVRTVPTGSGWLEGTDSELLVLLNFVWDVEALVLPLACFEMFLSLGWQDRNFSLSPAASSQFYFQITMHHYLKPGKLLFSCCLTSIPKGPSLSLLILHLVPPLHIILQGGSRWLMQPLCSVHYVGVVNQEWGLDNVLERKLSNSGILIFGGCKVRKC